MIAPPIQTDDDDDDNDGDGDNKSILVMKMFKLMTAMIVTMTSRFPCCVLLALSWNTAGGVNCI